MLLLRLVIASIVMLSSLSVSATEVLTPLSLKERAQKIDEITAKRVNSLLPLLMAKNGIDMWLLISREYNEDPVLKTMLPATWLSARRRTMLAFFLTDDEEFKAYAIAPYSIGNVFERAWDKKVQPDQWQALVDLIKKHKPKNIGVNQSDDWGHADGLVASEKTLLLEALPSKYQSKVVSAEKLAVGWLETRIPEEIEIYKELGALAHHVIAEGFSSKTIKVGETTTDDLVWWFREKVLALNLQTWFHTSVSIQRSDKVKFDHESSFTNGYGSQVVQQGDLLHVDFGLSYLRLHTDTQQHAYVLKDGETSAPEFLVEALKNGNQLQDIFTQNFKVGDTGNYVLAKSLAEAKAQKLKSMIYTHPLGYHGHAAGTTLGMWDSQEGVPGDGDYPLHENTAYSIELNNAYYAKPWQKEIKIMLEEDAFFDGKSVEYFSGRQTELLLVK